MRRRLIAVTIGILGASLLGASCGSTSPSAAGSFTWSVDSRSYEASPVGLVYANESRNTFAGFTCAMGQSVTIATPGTSISFHKGTYASPFTPTSGSTTAADAFSIVINEGLPGPQTGPLAPPVPSWVASAGTLSFSVVDGSHIVGTFDVTLVPNANSTESGTAHATGTFDVPPFAGAGNLCSLPGRR